MCVISMSNLPFPLTSSHPSSFSSHLSLFQDDNVVSFDDRIKPMGNDERCPPRHKILEGFLHWMIMIDRSLRGRLRKGAERWRCISYMPA